MFHANTHEQDQQLQIPAGEGTHHLEMISPPPQTVSQLILIHVSNLLRLDAQIIEGLPLGRMVETNHQSWNIDTESYPLMVSPRFSQTMTAVIPL